MGSTAVLPVTCLSVICSANPTLTGNEVLCAVAVRFMAVRAFEGADIRIGNERIRALAGHSLSPLYGEALLAGLAFDKPDQKPVKVSDIVDIIPIANTAFRNNSYPAATVAPNGDVYATWSSLVSNSTGGLCPARTNTGCHASVPYSKSTNGGATWSSPALAFPALDAANRTPIGYPVVQPNGSALNAPAPRRVDTLFPALAATPSGRVYISAYAADVVSPRQTCADGPAPPVGRITCDVLGNYINNARLDYIVGDLTTSENHIVTTQPINTRYGFGGSFFGDYTDIATGSDDVFHAVWADSNNVQSVAWFYGFQFVPTPIHQQDIATAKGKF